MVFRILCAVIYCSVGGSAPVRLDLVLKGRTHFDEGSDPNDSTFIAGLDFLVAQAA